MCLPGNQVQEVIEGNKRIAVLSLFLGNNSSCDAITVEGEQWSKRPQKTNSQTHNANMQFRGFCLLTSEMPSTFDNL